jgi:very-short-patch-repair endonuclease
VAGQEHANVPKPPADRAQWGKAHDIHAIAPKPPIAAAVWVPAHVRGPGESEILRVAALQKGFVDSDQLHAAGLGRGAIQHRVKTRRLHLYHPGVYLVGRPSLEPLGAEMAAVLFFRSHAVLSHRTAATLWGLLQPTPGDVVVTVVGVDRRARPGIRVHRTQHLDRRDIRLRHGLPVTSPPRTILDLATDPDLEEAIAVAQARDYASLDEIRAALARSPRCKGAARLRALLETGEDSGLTRSWTERRMRALLKAAELPQPLANVPLLGYVADFLWPELKLIVETDGFDFHSSRSAFEHDRRRDQKLAAAGFTVIRVTPRQLREEPYAVIARIAQAIAARAA